MAKKKSTATTAATATTATNSEDTSALPPKVQELRQRLTKLFGAPGVNFSNFMAWRTQPIEEIDGKTTFTGDTISMTTPKIRLTSIGWQVFVPATAILGEREIGGGFWADLNVVDLEDYLRRCSLAAERFPS